MSDLQDKFEGRGILLGVTGGIAAYKAAELASSWSQQGAEVRVLMTQAAKRFITPLTFESVTRQPVVDEIWNADNKNRRPDHIDSSWQGDLFVVAPATADFIARYAHGFGDDIVCLSLLAWDGPVVVAPAMNDKMWANEAVQQNVATLRDRGVDLVEPGVGHLACGSHGPGRLADLVEIDQLVFELIGTPQP